jgi:hypothetical protein
MKKIDSNKTQIIMAVLLVILLIAQFFIGDQAPQQVVNEPPAPRVVDVPIFIRGTMNEWGVTNAFSANQDNTEFTAIVDLEPGSYKFKIADQTWSLVDLGGGGGPDTTVTFNNKVPLAIRGTDMILKIEEKTTVVMVLSGTITSEMNLELFKAKI